MQIHCWHARFVALPPQLRQMLAEIVSAPTFASTSFPSTFSPSSATRPLSQIYGPIGGRRAFSSSCRSLSLSRKKPTGPRPATRSKAKTKPAPSYNTSASKSTSKSTSKSSSRSALKPASKSTSKPSKPSKPTSKTSTPPSSSRTSSRPSSRPSSNSTKTRKSASKSSSKTTSKSPTKTTKSATKTTAKKPAATETKPPRRARTSAPLAPTDHIRALSFLPPPPSTEPAKKIPDGDMEAAAAALAKASAAVRVGPTPTSAALDRASSLFVRPEPEFLYSAPRFLNLPVNTKIPEVCILGRSNVGKSTLLNALAGLESGGKAGNSHGSKAARLGLAITSARAGCTKMMNGYGFGPPLRASTTQKFERVEMDEERKKREGVPDPSETKTGVVSRSQKRSQKAGEPTPQHSLILIDMPGYGFMSKSEWGVEITKYLERRATLRGAILLVDAVAGLKDGDRQALAMLRDANIKTTIILTKADKLLPPRLLKAPASVAAEKQAERSLAAISLGPVAVTPEPAFNSGDSEGEMALRASCLRVWTQLRKTERASFGTVPWMEGQGWVPEIVVTGAGDPRGGGFGVAGARLAICRMAGLIPKHELPLTKRQRKANKKAAAEGSPLEARPVVPFDQIQWSETSTEAVLDQTVELAYIARQESEQAGRKTKRRAVAASAEEVETEVAVEEEDADSEQLGLSKDLAPAEPKAPVRGRRRPWKRA